VTDISRSEFDALAARVDKQEPVAVVAVQVAEVIKDVGQLSADLRAHRAEHEADVRARSTARWRITGLVIAAVAAVDGPLITILISRGH
jgi:hypothetical protein